MTWPKVTLDQVATITGGSTPRRDCDLYWGGSIPWLTPTDLPMPGHSIADVTETASYITEEGLASCSAKLLPLGTVLFSSRATIGKLGIACVPLTTNQGFANFIPRGAVESKYLAYCLLHRTTEITALAGSTTFKEVTKTTLRRVKVPLPPKSEQRRIVEILDQADLLRRKRQGADEKARRVTFALFHRLFGDPATNSKNWPTELLDEDVVDFKYGTSVRCEASYDGLPVLRIPNIVRGTLDLTDLKYADLPAAEVDRLRLLEGDILFVRTNGNRDYVGRCSVFDLNDTYLFASYLIRGRFDRSKFLPNYVATCLSTPAGRAMLAKGIRTTAGQSNLSVKGLRELALPRPPIELQHSFSEQLTALNRLKITQLANTERVNRLFTVLLNRAFTGVLTAGWRERNKSELDAEIQDQFAALERAGADGRRPSKNEHATGDRDSGLSNRHAGHDMFNKAALVTYIVTKCHNPDRPLAIGRTKLAKLFYLVQRRAEISLTQQFARRAAGPLDDAIHKFLNLAKKNGWLEQPNAQGKLKPVVPARDPQPAIEHVRHRWAAALPAIDQTLEAMKDWGWESLERWATVEHTAQQILAEGKTLTLATVKAAIAACPEWRGKLNRSAFSDADIQSTIKGLRNQGFLPTEVGANP